MQNSFSVRIYSLAAVITWMIGVALAIIVFIFRVIAAPDFSGSARIFAGLAHTVETLILSAAVIVVFLIPGYIFGLTGLYKSLEHKRMTGSSAVGSELLKYVLVAPLVVIIALFVVLPNFFLFLLIFACVFGFIKLRKHTNSYYNKDR